MTEFCPECHKVIPEGRGANVDRVYYGVPYHKGCLLKKLENDPALPGVLRALGLLPHPPQAA